jgi:hypothetical protein
MRNNQQDGSVLVSLLIIMIFLSMTILSLGVISQSNISRATQRIYLLQAQYAAESGADAVVAYLNTTGSYPYSGQKKKLFEYSPTYWAEYEAAIQDDPNDANKKLITSTGRVYQPSSETTNPKYTYKIEVVVERSSESFTSSIVSRNSVEIASSVKSIIATSFYINEYIRVNKNTTDLQVDDLTIAGKYPDANNCSLSGAGNLVRNPNLPAGTKSKLHFAYNNCMDSTPGNTSDANFDVTANDPTLQKVASIYIPWSFKMNNADSGGEYTSGNCNDWTTAAPVIPSNGNNRKTHYPDSGTGTALASTCGGSGGSQADINLGSKVVTLKDHAHLRANLCKASSCKPTFVNPDTGTTKFLFVEGVINFENLYVSNGVGYPNGGTAPPVSSGNIVFISYSTSQNIPASKQCPSNAASIRLGKDGANSLFAPNAYFISTNGMMCIDQTKYATDIRSLGGISGKDIYISSNSGGVFELTFNPQFPLTNVPLDLSWRAAGVKRVY